MEFRKNGTYFSVVSRSQGTQNYFVLFYPEINFRATKSGEATPLLKISELTLIELSLLLFHKDENYFNVEINSILENKFYSHYPVFKLTASRNNIFDEEYLDKLDIIYFVKLAEHIRKMMDNI